MSRLIIITGHSSGLGRALLAEASRTEAVIIGLARRSVDSSHSRLHQISCDLSAADLLLQEVFQPVADMLKSRAWTQVTLINNAGTIQPLGLLGQLRQTELDAAVRLNLNLPLSLCNWLVHEFPKASLRLVQISSGAAHKPYSGWSAYCSSKAALRMLGEVFAAESSLSTQDRRVLIYEPGVLDTPMQSLLRQCSAKDFPAVERFIRLHDEGHLVSAEDSASQLWLKLNSPLLPVFSETRYSRE